MGQTGLIRWVVTLVAMVAILAGAVAAQEKVSIKGEVTRIDLKTSTVVVRNVGFIIGSMGGPEYALPVSGWVTTMGVDPDYQGRGVGKALLKAFIDVCEISRIPSRMMLPQNELFENMLLALGFEKGSLVDYVRKPK